MVTACQSSAPPVESTSTSPPIQNKKPSTQPSQEPKKKQTLPLKIYQVAKNGKMIFVELFPIGTPVRDVLAKWGTPESGDPGYLGYEKKCHCGLVSKDTQQVSAIKSNHPQVQALTIDQVKQDLGQPERSATSYGDPYILYRANQYHLSFYYEGNQVVSIYLEKK